MTEPRYLREVQTRTVAAIFERFSERSIGDEIFVENVIEESLRSMRGGRAPHFASLANRPLNAVLIEIAVSELRRIAGDWAPHENFEQIERALNGLARRPARLGRSDLGRGEIDAILERHIAHLIRIDRQTGEHSRAVGAWCRRIAETMGLSRSEVTFVMRCGLVHDIGKRLTPLEILQAPRELSDDEWTIMRRHVLDGFDLVTAEPILLSFAAAVRNHHERFDGRGYPDGLRGEEIPLPVRIVSVADSFNAMIAQRPYRRALPPEKALEDLARNRNTQFDPEIVDVMGEIVNAPLGAFA
ncbi:MAG: hypothetical protein NVSMB64_24160 [Candidatus Velthaea sp.]